MTTIELGLRANNKSLIDVEVKNFLADSYILYLHTQKEFAKLRPIKEVVGIPTETETLIKLTESHEKVIRAARNVLKIAQTSMDDSTASLVSEQMRIHEKTVWILRSMTKNQYFNHNV